MDFKIEIEKNENLKYVGAVDNKVFALNVETGKFCIYPVEKDHIVMEEKEAEVTMSEKDWDDESEEEVSQYDVTCSLFELISTYVSSAQEMSKILDEKEKEIKAYSKRLEEVKNQEFENVLKEFSTEKELDESDISSLKDKIKDFSSIDEYKKELVYFWYSKNPDKPRTHVSSGNYITPPEKSTKKSRVDILNELEI